jgi:hypothetical protein
MTLAGSRIEQFAQGVKEFELRDTAGGTLPAIDSGAHIELEQERRGEAGGGHRFLFLTVRSKTNIL